MSLPNQLLPHDQGATGARLDDARHTLERARRVVADLGSNETLSRGARDADQRWKLESAEKLMAESIASAAQTVASLHEEIQLIEKAKALFVTGRKRVLSALRESGVRS